MYLSSIVKLINSLKLCPNVFLFQQLWQSKGVLMANTVVSLLPNRLKTLHSAKPESCLHVCNTFSSLFSGSVISSFFFWLMAEETAGGSHISCRVEKTANGCSFFNQHLFFFLFPWGFLFFPKKASICSIIY